MTDIPADDLLALTADIVAAHVSFNKVDIAELPTLIGGIHDALGRLGAADAPAPQAPFPAVPVSSSVKGGYLVCLEDGKKLKMLKRYLAAQYGLTPAEYRARWGLPSDYPMVAPDYARVRGDIARSTGLGRKPQAAAAVPAVDEQPAPEPAAEPVSAPPIAEAPPEEVAAVNEPVPAKPTEPEPSSSAPPKRRTLRPVFNAEAAARPAEAPAAKAVELPGQPPAPQDILCHAVAQKSCVTATYNKTQVVLAPHIVFTRHDEPFMRGITIERDGKRPAQLKLGTFRLTGLIDLKPSPRRFVPSPLFVRDDPEYSGTTICSIS